MKKVQLGIVVAEGRSVGFDGSDALNCLKRSPNEEEYGDEEIAEGVLIDGALEIGGKLPGKEHCAAGQGRVHDAEGGEKGGDEEKESGALQTVVDEGGEGGGPDEAG